MQKNILITGASSGIGADAARVLIANGFRVIATVRKTEDETRLIEMYGEKIKVLRIDLGELQEIEKLPDLIKQKLGIEELHGLLNNAGVALAAPFALQQFTEIQEIIKINVLAVMKVTQVLLPMMKSGSRIVNISSVAGKNAAPFLAIYAASKHAIEGFSEAIRKEFILLGIKVMIVAPGSIKTPIWKKGFDVIKETYKQSIFAQPFERFMKIAQNSERNALDVSVVSADILHAFTAAEPKVRYAPIPNRFSNWYLPMIIPTKCYDYLTAKTLGLLPK